MKIVELLYEKYEMNNTKMLLYEKHEDRDGFEKNHIYFEKI
jgi:hypothetical protein